MIHLENINKTYHNGAPVSYTHLDVYKRQADTTVAVYWIALGKGTSPKRRITDL